MPSTFSAELALLLCVCSAAASLFSDRLRCSVPNFHLPTTTVHFLFLLRALFIPLISSPFLLLRSRAGLHTFPRIFGSFVATFCLLLFWTTLVGCRFGGLDSTYRSAVLLLFITCVLYYVPATATAAAFYRWTLPPLTNCCTCFATFTFGAARCPTARRAYYLCCG